MQNLILFILIIFLGCSKQDKTSNQSADSIKTGGSAPTENIKQTNQTTSQPVKMKEYKKGEPIELYDLIYILLPDESDAAGCINLSKVEGLQAIKWQEGSENAFGHLNITINGKKEISDWTILLEDKEKSCLKFEIGKGTSGYDFPYDEDKETALNYLFPKQDYISKILKKNKLENSAQLYVLYEVKFTNKMMYWLEETYDSGTRTGSFDLTFHLNKNDIEDF